MTVHDTLVTLVYNGEKLFFSNMSLDSLQRRGTNISCSVQSLTKKSVNSSTAWQLSVILSNIGTKCGYCNSRL